MALTLEEKKSKFIEALKKTYKLQYDAVQPIPYVKDRLYCVDKIFVEGGTECLRHNSWIRLNSYKEMFSADQVQSKRCILEGEPGYGKSTLTLQLAYDWSNDVKESPLSKVEILILLKLRQLGGIRSIYRAIKLFLLSDERRLKVKDIEEIFQSCSSIIIALDGYDEYPEKDSHRDNEINQIILKKMFENFHVTLTTRYLPTDYETKTIRFRLTGFDSRARDEYIRKAVVGDDDNAVESIKQKLKENSILADLCEVPLIFVMFAHMAHEQKSFQNFNTVTSFFKYMIRCFHEHTRLKSKDENVKEFNHYENEHTALDKVAFEGLARKDQQLTWRREKLVRLLGKPFYDQYISIGILVEEKVVDQNEMGNDCEFIIMVRFYHKLFCEWYAGHYLAFFLARQDVKVQPWNDYRYRFMLRGDVPGESDVLNSLDPFDLQYLFRFSCGLRPEAGKKIIDYLGSRKDGDKFSILCILEQGGNIDDVMTNVKEICSRDVEIKRGDTALLQRSTIQLLDIASRNEIPISCVTLNQSFEQVDKDEIKLRSGQTLPKLLTVEKIHIETEEEELEQRHRGKDVIRALGRSAAEKERELSEDEVMKICAYALGSKRLKEISFGHCLLPLSLSRTVQAAEIINRNIKVTWCRYGFCFNFQSGLWEVDDVNTCKRLCSSEVKIWNDDSEILQRCTILLLENASNNNIPIYSVWLEGCSPRVSESGLTPQSGLISQSGLILQSGLSLSILSSLQRLEIHDYLRKLTTREFVSILGYSSHCTSLKELKFLGYQLPQTKPVGLIPPLLKSRKVKVWNRLPFLGYHRLDLTTGLWQRCDRRGNLL